MKKNARASWIQGVAVVGLIASSAAAQTVVYDNSVSPLNSYFANQTEFGDQINIDGGGWIAHTFSFEYFAAGLGGGETAKLRLYANNGVPTGEFGVQAPGELLYESAAFPIINGNFPITITDLANLNIALPNTMTWSIKTTGVTGGEEFGLKLYDPPAVGSSFNDIWRFTADGWELAQIPGFEANFGARLVAVPEPGTGLLLALGGIALFLRRRAAGR